MSTGFVWKAPPAKRNTVFNGRVLARLHSRPGQWARIRVYSGRGRTAGDVAHPTDIEIDVRYIDAHKPTGRTELYARWVPGGTFD